MAQTRVPLLPRQHGFGVMPANTHVSVQRYANGDTLASFRLSTRARFAGRLLGASAEHSLSAVLVRYAASGRVQWTRQLRTAGDGNRDGRFDDARVVALPDGGAIVYGHHTQGEHTAATLIRIASSGHDVWRWDAPPSGRFATISRALVRGNAVVVTGSFSRGRFGLPGGETWSSRRYLSHYLASVDLRNGAVTWARTVAGGIEETDLGVATDGTILFATHVRRRGQDLLVRRFAPDGEPQTPVRWGSARDDFPHAIGAIGDGFAVLVATSRPGGGETMRLLAFDREGELVFEHEVPDRSVLVRQDGPAVVSVLSPGPVVRRESGLWTDRAYVLSVDGAGQRVREQVVLSGGGQSWMVSSLRADGAIVSGVARRGRAAPEAFFAEAASLRLTPSALPAPFSSR